MLAAMEQPREGALHVFGQLPAPALRARVGVVFQENAQDPLMTVHETLQLAGRMFGMAGPRIRERATALLDAFGLSGRGRDRIETLSGGMRRRVEVARALLHDPALLILDEPTTGVDPEERRALWRALLQAERGARTVLLTTNDLAEADGVCDLVAFMSEGRVVASGTPAELKQGLRRDAVRVQWHGITAEQLADVAAMPGTGGVTQDGDTVLITADDAAGLVPQLFALAPGAIRSVTIDRSTLEDAFFQHVGRRAPASEPVPA
jgi:ABC-type multidrug transport system ATPase subunit